MRTLQEKYNAIQEGKFSKENFLRDARLQLPNLVTQYNGYDDAVQILKNRGMIQQPVVEEARLTKNSLTDYRYKPTNEMDKYPYEQILRGLRVELEGLGVTATPTPEEYRKALAKVLKNLEKDEIFYTNQIAGIKANAKRTDLMVDATPKNEVDKENGLQKAQLKEAIKGVIKNILSEGNEFGEGEDVYEMYRDDEDDDELDDSRGLFKGFRDDEDDEIDYDDENFSDPLIDGDEADDIPHPRGYEEASDEEDFDDLFESVSLKDLL